MVNWLRAASDVLPMTYAVDALTEIGAHADVTGALVRDAVVIGGAAAGFLVLGAATLRRRTD
jgi:ABC-2 type transport system permease protein